MIVGPSADSAASAAVAETERLRLRRLDKADAAFLLELLNQPSWLEFIGDRNVHTLAQAADYITHRIDAQFEQHGYGMWGMELSEERRLIGLVGLVKRDYLPAPDLGFALLDGCAGRGLAYEAAVAVLPNARAAGLERLLAITRPSNHRAITLLHRLGFELEASQPVPGDLLPVLRYTKTLG